MTHRAAAWLLTCIALSVTAAAHAAPVEFSSGSQRTDVIELYTSEGCSSCPPAERLLNRYRNNPELWRHYVPLAFHVDYWDYLGWKDRFAQPEFDQRQRRYVHLGRLSGVYTPAFVVNGQGQRPGALRHTAPMRTSPAGILRVSVDGSRVQARLQHADDALPKRLTLHLAVLGMGLTSHIRAGENAGRESRHEFVVLAHLQVAGDNGGWQAALPDVREKAPRLALAAWVTSPDDPTPLQATGGYLP